MIIKYTLRIIILSIAIGLLLFSGCKQQPSKDQINLAMYPEKIEGEADIRVQVLETRSSLELIVAGPYKLVVKELNGRKQSGGGSKPVTIRVSTIDNGIKLGINSYETAEVIPVGNTKISIRFVDSTGKTVTNNFPGSFIFSRERSGNLRVVVKLPMERYLIGVLPSEMPLSFPPEALKAQAVAARTYALYQLKSRQSQPYDVYADVRSQMWVPSKEADPRSRMAINSTRGLIVTDNFRLFPTYFHSDCGGETAKAKYIFAASDITPLSGRECPHGPQSYKWRYTVSKATLSARLTKGGVSSGRILRIEILDENKRQLQTIGRVYFIKLFMDNGVVQTVPANKFRIALGAGKNELASTFFNVSTDSTGKNLTFEGRGFGHGVGMCQHGAMYLAKEGQNFDEILKFYYPGSTIVKVW